MRHSSGAGLIAVVDDDSALRQALSSLVRSAGFRCAAYESANHFLDACNLAAVDCLLLDIRMPGMSGLDLQRELARTVPVIFVTAVSDGVCRQQALSQGAVAFLPKPFDDNELLNVIQAALNQKNVMCRNHYGSRR